RVCDKLSHSLVPPLPGQAIAVSPPAARALLAAVGELLPEVVDLVLVVAVDQEGDGLVELEVRAAVDAGEAHAADLPVHRHDHAGLARSSLRVMRLVQHAAFLEDRDVEL